MSMNIGEEEITTIFVVGFPDCIQEREFFNCFTFAKGFESAILKVPVEEEQAGYGRKQIIGFAKFVTRQDATNAKNTLTGRKIDPDKHCILKAEFAKKNLHSKRLDAKPQLYSHEASFPLRRSLTPLSADTSPLHSSSIFPALSIQSNTSIQSNSTSPVQAQHSFASGAVFSPGGQQEGSFLGQRSGAVFGESAFNTPAFTASVFPPPTQATGAFNGGFNSSVYKLNTVDAFTPPASTGHSRRSSSNANLFDTAINHFPHQTDQKFLASHFSSDTLSMNFQPDAAIFDQQSYPTDNHYHQPPYNAHFHSAFSSPDPQDLRLNTQISLGFLQDSSDPLPDPSPLSDTPFRQIDQNAPCNTLYVGNLPPTTQPEELEALFSKTIGYRRLCFRNRPNGPMCFVEFEDVGYATRVMYELYGWRLSGHGKGGIRLSFSKNPLGVRVGREDGIMQ